MMHLVRTAKVLPLMRTKPSGKALLVDQLHTEIATLRAIREEMRQELAAAEEPMPELKEQIRRATAAMKDRYREVWHLREKR